MSRWTHILKPPVLFTESCRWLRLKSPFIVDMIGLDLTFTGDQKFLHESFDDLFIGCSQQIFLIVSIEYEHIFKESDKFYGL